MASTDRPALAALFQATDGAGWSRNAKWDTDAELAAWYGVEVDEEGRVIELKLDTNNLQGVIPKELGALSKLRKLNLSRNQLTEIPMAVAEYLRVRGNRAIFISDGNPWKKPPPQVIVRGSEAMVKYLEDLDTFGSSLSNRLKVVLVGLGNAGKTSIAVRLERGAAADLPRSDERTVGVEIRDIELGPKPASEEQGSGLNLAIKLWDFAGQRAYYDTHQMFLTRGAMFILVVDMFAYSVENRREEALEQWLDILQSRVPGSVVLLVGTHRDKFGNDSRLLGERLQSFKADVKNILERIREDCKVRKRLNGREGNQQRFEPLQVVEETLVMDCKCSNEEELKAEVKGLSSLIEKVAYGGNYPTVEREVPAPYAHAVAILEAARRGADLTGAGGDHIEVVRRLGEGKPEQAKAFMKFSDALLRFMQLWSEQKVQFLSSMFLTQFFQLVTKRQERPPDAEQLFWRAIELPEAEGSILLTYVDGSAVWRQDDSMIKGGVIIHVSPVRFADLVRRIVDVRTLKQGLKERMELQLEAFARTKGKGVTLQQLSRQQNKFYAAGEVSRDFLEFLWDRDLRLGPTSMFSPPLELGDHDLEVMVNALVELRMMFPVRDEARLYVVRSCLPEYVSHWEDPIEMLELGVGSALFSQRLDIVGARTEPPGLVPRLLAWVGAKSGRFQACWKHGCCFAFGDHLTLIYECRSDAGRPSIMCCVKGDANMERAGDVLERIASEVGDLIRHEKYGFPGLDLREQSMEKHIVTRETELEVLLEKLRERLEDHMNVRFDELERKSERIAGRVYTSTFENMTKLDRLRTSVEAVGDSAAAMNSKLDAMGAVVGKCLLVSAAQAETCPRLVWIEEDNPHAASSVSPSRFSHFRRMAWDKVRRKTKEALGRTRFRVRFLCAHDLSLAECGHDGRGYVVDMKDWQRWLQRCLPLLQITLWLVRVGVSVIARADVLPVDSLLGALRELAGEEVAAQIEAIDLSREDISAGRLAQAVDDRVKVFSKAYTQLREFVHAQEDKIAAKPSMASDSTAETSLEERLGGCALPPHGAEKRSFEKDMRLVHRVRDRVVEYAWVRGANVDAWQATPAAVTAQGTRQAMAFDP